MLKLKWNKKKVKLLTRIYLIKDNNSKYLKNY